jgi:hypothetical protein
LRVVFNVAHIWDIGGHFIQRDFVYVVTAHRINAVRLTIHYVLIVEEEFICFHELGLALTQFIGDDTVFEDVAKFEIIVGYRLAAEHNHRVRIYHVQTYEPDLLLCHYVYDLPITTLSVKLLNRCAVSESLIADCVDVPFSEGAAIRTPNSLRKLG